MAQYRLYHLQNFRLAAADNLEAADDLEAAALARTQAKSDMVELWCGSRRVRTIGPLSAPATRP